MPGEIPQSRTKLLPAFEWMVFVTCLVLVLGGSALPKNAQAAIGFVQSQASIAGASGINKIATFGGWVTTGNLITVGCAMGTEAASVSVSDTYGNTYTPIGSI